jgi:D-threo-aldose 1-dehydrogenase
MAAPSPDLMPLGVADLRVTRLCFGTGTLFRLHSSRERQRLLDAAFDLGIRHFDTARSYGLGDAEREVGRFLGRHRGEVTVATKFGMRVSSTGRLLKPLQTAARRVVGLFPGLRKQLRKRPLPIVAPRCFDLASARESLETSLRELAVERIDLLFLHEPDERSLIDSELPEWLADSRDAGLIRTWGLSGPLPGIMPVKNARHGLAEVLQYACDAVSRTAVPSGPRLMYSPFANAIEPVVSALAGSPAAASRWRDEVDLPLDRNTVAGLLLAEACCRSDPCPVVFSTTQVSHLESLVRSAYDPEVQNRVPAFRQWINESSKPEGGEQAS